MNTTLLKEKKHLIEDHCIEGKSSVLDEDDLLTGIRKAIERVDDLNGNDPDCDPLLRIAKRYISSAKSMNNFQGFDFVEIAEHLERR